jgi:hypothetical protein
VNEPVSETLSNGSGYCWGAGCTAEIARAKMFCDSCERKIDEEKELGEQQKMAFEEETDETDKVIWIHGAPYTYKVKYSGNGLAYLCLNHPSSLKH